MACEHRIWRYEGCDHEEELDLRCSLGSDPDHVHNTVVVETTTPPRCSICNPPEPISEETARDLAQAATHRHLPAPGSFNNLFRGVNAEILTYGQTTPDPPTSLDPQGGAAVNGATGNGTSTEATSRHAPHRSLDTVRNVPANTSGPAVEPSSPDPGAQEQASNHQETGSNIEY
ncbi:MAG: hypothetical protein Q9170_002448 [Blastenia crenularia]